MPNWFILTSTGALCRTDGIPGPRQGPLCENSAVTGSCLISRSGPEQRSQAGLAKRATSLRRHAAPMLKARPTMLHGRMSMTQDELTMDPLFSIITPTFNCGPDAIDQTMRSVLSQDFDSLEFLIIDADSNDGTREWLSQVEDPRVMFSSEPDKGIYDGMNKGIDRARGRFLLFLGAGDILLPGALRQVSQRLPKTNRALVYGNVLWGGATYDGKFSKLKICEKNICHQAIFYGRDVFKTVGRYSLKYRILADWAFNIECFGNRLVTTRYVPITVAIYEGGGASDTNDAAFVADRRALLLTRLGRITYARYRLASRVSRLVARSRMTLSRLIHTQP
jgi:glycosyltransferase involved in cell wall biosynthesis